MMKTLEYRIAFTTPAFLGNNEQSGQWRTPPFKALLRHWWRVAVAREHHYNVKNIRKVEGRLFGNAWLQSGATKSSVRMRLDKWNKGSGETSTLRKHPYLGYGAVDRKQNTALQDGDSATLSLAVPEQPEDDIINTLALINQFGTIGGRSRNGWGSLSLEPSNGTPELAVDAGKFASDLTQALQKDWPHAIGRDNKGLLLWQSEVARDWQGALTKLEQLRKNLNSTFKTDRHWLNYPVTKHDPENWSNRRLPSSLRFKVVPENGQVRALVFHLPCLPPKGFSPNRTELMAMWDKVHTYLDDDAQKLSRVT